MRFFSTFLLLFLFLFSFSPQVKCQNLIYDWSVEEYETCPTGLWITLFVPHWLSFRAKADYFNFCSTSTLGPLSNAFGWQHPKTGAGIMGVVTFSPGLANAREYPGVELIEPLIVGEFYEVSFYVATAYSENPWLTGRATNNLGALFMTENYLSDEELGPIPNFAHFNVDSVVIDTAQWIHIKGTVLADSAYSYVAFGNFFDDSNTVDSLLAEREFTAIAYYYFDDFCVVPAGGDCSISLSNRSTQEFRSIKVFPNPGINNINVSSPSAIRALVLYSATGAVLKYIRLSGNEEAQVNVSAFSSGIYILQIETEEGIARRKIVIQH